MKIWRKGGSRENGGGGGNEIHAPCACVLVLSWNPIKAKSINSEMVQHRIATFVINRQRNASSVGDMLQHLNWDSLEDRLNDAQLVMTYKIANVNVAIIEKDRLKTITEKELAIFHYPSIIDRLNKDKNHFSLVRYLEWLG